MSDAEAPTGLGLQFDRVQDAEPAATGARATATCAVCRREIDREYYDINGTTVCPSCRARIAAAVETPRDIGTLLVAGAAGLVAAIIGAVIYYAVIALAHLEIGIVAILTGYLVGYAVRKAAGNRGGRRFQMLAVVLTYVSVAMAYAPLIVRSVAAKDIFPLLGLILALPVLVIVNSLPSGLLSAAIIFFGMQRAWRMTAAPTMVFNGPYRVAGTPASNPA